MIDWQTAGGRMRRNGNTSRVSCTTRGVGRPSRCAFVVGSADPGECAVAPGIPSAVVEAVNSLFAYRETNFNAALCVVDWLESVPVGAEVASPVQTVGKSPRCTNHR
ncbi:hypothetical protein [Burkholderia glumae]|uniref:hypothetical protein n=1 Tax=Burkholderia glumae TaxID=337 RepID=UPI0020B3AAC5|nr:hypothetical protein [Burkholderia glumae]MCQ0034562.1 hypothetical protein [Burkholderia glumae]MCQ0039920.1 hypothetical protein [Burkholderia glumae]